MEKEIPLNIFLAQVTSYTGHPKKNADNLVKIFLSTQNDNYEIEKPDVVVFPALFLTGLNAQDLFFSSAFQEFVVRQIKEIALFTRDTSTAIILGSPWYFENEARKSYNAVLCLRGGKVYAFRTKRNISDIEKRYFSFQKNFYTCDHPIRIKNTNIGCFVGEDMLCDTTIQGFKDRGGEVAFHLQTSSFEENTRNSRVNAVCQQAKKFNIPCISINTVGGCDNVVFEGGSFVVDSNGNVCTVLPFFEESSDTVAVYVDGKISTKNKHNVHHAHDMHDTIKRSTSDSISEIYRALVLSLRDYARCNNFSFVIVGLSGGIDSALVATLAADALGPSCVYTYMITSRYTSDSSIQDARMCAENIGVHHIALSLEEACTAVERTITMQAFTRLDLGEQTKQNIQARLRGLILMGLSNQTGALLLATGNKSEILTGYSTLYGDTCGGFCLLKDIYKTRVYELARLRNTQKPRGCLGKDDLSLIPQQIFQKPPSAELAPHQKDTDDLPPYEILDKIIELFLEKRWLSQQDMDSFGYDVNKIKNVINRVKNSGYKRYQGSLGPKITHLCVGENIFYPVTIMFGNEEY